MLLIRNIGLGTFEQCGYCSSDIVLNDKNWDRDILGNHYGTNAARLGEDHMVALSADVAKAVGFEDF